jgi:hypothetical protein
MGDSKFHGGSKVVACGSISALVRFGTSAVEGWRTGNGVWVAAWEARWLHPPPYLLLGMGIA